MQIRAIKVVDAKASITNPTLSPHSNLPEQSSWRPTQALTSCSYRMQTLPHAWWLKTSVRKSSEWPAHTKIEGRGEDGPFQASRHFGIKRSKKPSPHQKREGRPEAASFCLLFCSFLEGVSGVPRCILHISRRVVGRSRRLVDLAFGFHVLVADKFTDTFFDGAFCLVGKALHRSCRLLLEVYTTKALRSGSACGGPLKAAGVGRLGILKARQATTKLSSPAGRSNRLVLLWDAPAGRRVRPSGWSKLLRPGLPQVLTTPITVRLMASIGAENANCAPA
ncbi:hypothetical protein ABH994_001370 [Bradyrhizobium yuanmingense]